MEIEEIVTKMVKIEYEVKDSVYPFADIIEMTEEEYIKLKKSDIDKIQLNKYNKWLEVMTGGVVSG